MPELQTILSYRVMRSASPTHGEGQALALREEEVFFPRSAGPVTATLNGL